MKIKMILCLSLVGIGISSLEATVLTNATGNDLKLKVSYSEQCLPDDPLQDLVDSKYLLPNGGKIDISGSPLPNRQKGVCYTDIVSITIIATTPSDDQSVTEIATTWSNIKGKDFNTVKSIIIRTDSRGKMYLQ
jgi:hypothetical protein